LLEAQTTSGLEIELTIRESIVLPSRMPINIARLIFVMTHVSSIR